MADLPSGTAISHYRLVAAARRGEWADVYSAIDSRSNESVELAIVRPALLADAARLRQFVNDLKAAAQLTHPHLSRILDFGKTVVDGVETPYVAIERSAGEPLRAALDRRQPIGELLPAFRDAAHGLAALHGSGVVHRDLRPDVIVLTAGGAKVAEIGRGALTQPRLLWRGDFAEVWIAEVETDAASVAYLAPEVAEGASADARSDLFSFGVMLYEAATGQHPYLAPTPSTTIENLATAQPKPPREIAPDISQQLDRIIRRCVAKRPDQRFASASELAASLDALLGGAAEEPTPVAPKRSLDLRLVGGAAAAAVALFALILLLPRFLADDPKPQKPPASETKETSIERITESGDIGTAVLSPDASAIAFTRGPAIVVRRIEDDEEIEILKESASPIASLTFSRDGSDIWYTTEAGELFRIAAQGAAPSRVGVRVHSPIAFSPSGEQFAFVRRDGAKTSLVVSDLEGKSQKAIAVRTLPEALSTAGPAWSPARPVVACAAIATRPFRRTQLLEIPVGRGPSKIVADKLPNLGRLVWLPNGRAILATSRDRFSRGGWIVDTVRGQIRRVVVDLDDYADPTVPIGGRSFAAVEREHNTSIWRSGDRDAVEGGAEGIARLPDGSLVFAGSPDGRGLFWLGINEEEPRRLTEQFASEPAAARDGRFLVYCGGELKQWGLWRAKADGSEPKLLVSDRNGTPREPQIAPAGSSVIYTLLSADGKAPTLWRVPIEGGSAAQLTTVHAEMPAISPDGRLVAVRTVDAKSGDASIATVAISGGSVTPRIPVDPLAFAWLPDGSGIVYSTAGSQAIWKQNLTGSRREKIRDLEAGEAARLLVDEEGNLAAAAVRVERRDAVIVRNFR